MLRRIKNLKALRNRDSLKKLEFGCGHQPSRHGFLGVDIRNFSGVTYVCNAWEIDKYVSENSVEEIYSRHFFEHLTFDQADITLKVWHKILVPNGELQIIVPDVRYHIQQFLDESPDARSEANPDWTVLQHAVAGFWGWQREGISQMWDIHKSGYDFRTLEMSLKEKGFCDIHRLDDNPWNLNVRCFKPRC